VDGHAWPVHNSATVWLPPGEHVLRPSAEDTAWQLRDFNGTLSSAATVTNGLEFSYESSSRALATLSAKPTRVEVDGENPSKDGAPPTIQSGNNYVLVLPRGQHLVTLVY
jgi:hypothetical protein